MKKVFLALFLVAISITGFSGEKLIILHTNDTHSQIDPDYDGKGGILRRKALIDSVRSAEKNVLLVDAGDAVQGTPYFSLYGGAVDYPLMDSLGYDIQILGNHEFDNGIDSVAHFYKNLKAIKLSANYDFSNTPLKGLFQPYVIKEYSGKKIGFIGINLDPKGIISSQNYTGLVYKDAIQVADSIAEILKKDKGVDKVIVISHIGYGKDKDGLPDDTNLIKNSHYIDVVIGGHSHTLIDPYNPNSVSDEIENADGKEVLIAQSGKAGKYIGYIEIELDDEAMEADSKIMPITKQYDNRIDKNLETFIAPYKHKVDSLMNHTIAYSTVSMNEKNRNVGMNWVADAAMKIVPSFYNGKVDLAVMNKGGIRRNLEAGPVSEGLIAAMFPFDNRLVVMRIKGEELIKAFSVMAQRGGDAVSNGVKIKYTRDGVIKSATLNGKKINKNTYYTIVTLDYLASGNDYMKPFTTGQILATANKRFGLQMMDYVKDLGIKGINITSSGEARMYR